MQTWRVYAETVTFVTLATCIWLIRRTIFTKFMHIRYMQHVPNVATSPYISNYKVLALAICKIYT